MSAEPIRRTRWILLIATSLFLSACYEVKQELITPEHSIKVQGFEGNVAFHIRDESRPQKISLRARYVEKRKHYSIDIKDPGSERYVKYGSVRAFNLAGNYFIFQLTTRSKSFILFIVKQRKNKNEFDGVWIDWKAKNWAFKQLNEYAEQHNVKLSLGLVGNTLSGKSSDILKFMMDHRNLPLADFTPPPGAPCGKSGPFGHFCAP